MSRKLSIIIIGNAKSPAPVTKSVSTTKAEKVPEEDLHITWALAPLLMLGARNYMALPTLANLLALRTGSRPVGPDLETSPNELARFLLELMTSRRFLSHPGDQTTGSQT